MAKIILVASGKGGAGKSTVSALLGEVEFVKDGERVIKIVFEG